MNISRIVVLGFDMETDLGSWTPYYEGLKKGTPMILNLLSEEDIKATFFFTGEAAKLHPEVVKDVYRESHEVGCHSIFHETIGDELFPIPGVKPLLSEEIPLRLKIATSYVEETLGDKVFSFRAPRLWGSTVMLNTLEDLGYKADASYPLYYYLERIVPYHPDKEDWTKEGNLGILEIPIFADITMDSKDPYGRDRDQWPLFRTEGAEELMKHINSFVSFVDGKGLPVVLCFYFHPWEFIEMPRGLIHYGEGSVMPDEFITRNCGDYALKQLRELIKLLKSISSQFFTAKELAEVWDDLYGGVKNGNRMA